MDFALESGKKMNKLAGAGFKRTKLLEKSGIYHQKEVCHFHQKVQLLHFDWLTKNNEVKKEKKHRHRQIIHNEIYNMHIENKLGQFSFLADLRIPTQLQMCFYNSYVVQQWKLFQKNQALSWL